VVGDDLRVLYGAAAGAWIGLLAVALGKTTSAMQRHALVGSSDSRKFQRLKVAGRAS